MGLLKTLILTSTLLFTLTSTSWAKQKSGRGGNGNFAFKQSRALLKRASLELVAKIRRNTRLNLLNNDIRIKELLLKVVTYNNIEQLPNKDHVYRAEKLLAMDYSTKEGKEKITTYRPFYFLAVAKGLKKVQEELLHEASHIWGKNEDESAVFAKDYLLQLDTKINWDLLTNRTATSCKKALKISADTVSTVVSCKKMLAIKEHNSRLIDSAYVWWKGGNATLFNSDHRGCRMSQDKSRYIKFTKRSSVCLVKAKSVVSDKDYYSFMSNLSMMRKGQVEYSDSRGNYYMENDSKYGHYFNVDKEKNFTSIFAGKKTNRTKKISSYYTENDRYITVVTTRKATRDGIECMTEHTSKRYLLRQVVKYDKRRNILTQKLQTKRWWQRKFKPLVTIVYKCKRSN